MPGSLQQETIFWLSKYRKYRYNFIICMYKTCISLITLINFLLVYSRSVLHFSNILFFILNNNKIYSTSQKYITGSFLTSTWIHLSYNFFSKVPENTSQFFFVLIFAWRETLNTKILETLKYVINKTTFLKFDIYIYSIYV